MPRAGGRKVKGPAEGLAKDEKDVEGHVATRKGPTEGSQHAKGPAEGLAKDEQDVEGRAFVKLSGNDPSGMNVSW
jgi:hypothetical protein